MGTRSTIAIEQADGTVKQVYCHWDGYPEHNGKILYTHYKDFDKTLALIAHGAMSTLGAGIGIKRPFDNPHKYGTAAYYAFQEQYRDQCTFYTRDRDEPLVVNTFWNFEMYSMTHPREEYAYILRNNGKWYVAAYDRDFFELEKILQELEEVA